MWNRLGSLAVRHGARVAVKQIATVGETVLLRRGIYRQVFTITLPVTIYIHAAHSQVVVHRAKGDQTDRIELEAMMRGAFGLNLSVEQDEAGIYIIARRKPVAGALARIDFKVTAPPEARILAHLTPGVLMLEDVDGTVEALPIRA